MKSRRPRVGVVVRAALIVLSLLVVPPATAFWGASDEASLSGDGRWLALRVDHDGLLDADENGRSDVYLVHLPTGHVQIVSATEQGNASDRDSDQPSVSADGGRVVFRSMSTDLVDEPSASGRPAQAYAWSTAGVTLVSATAAGAPADEAVERPMVSADGRVAAFQTTARNLAPDFNNADDVYAVRLGAPDTLRRASLGSDGERPSHPSILADVGPTGDVLILTAAGELDPADEDGATDAYVHRFTSKAIGIQGGGAVNGTVLEARLWDDGIAAVLDAADGSVLLARGGQVMAFLHAVRAYGLDVTPDGRYIVFVSAEPGLVAADQDADDDVFLLTTATGALRRLSGGSEPGDSWAPSISDAGRLVAFTTAREDVVGFLGPPQVVVVDLLPGEPGAPSSVPGAGVNTTQTNPPAVLPPPSEQEAGTVQVAPEAPERHSQGIPAPWAGLLLLPWLARRRG